MTTPALRRVVPAALFAGVLAPLNSTMIVVALPTMLADLGASLAWGSWVVLSYLVAMAAVQPLGGSLGDRFGQRRMVALGLIGFLVASLVAALAANVETLVAARTVQALTGAIAIPNGTALVRTLAPAGDHGRAFGLLGSGMSLAAALGPPLGGLITETLGWRWIFAANVPVVVVGLLLVLGLPAQGARRTDRGFDLAGAAGLFAGLVALALAATLWRVPQVPTWLTSVFAAVALAAAVWLPRHVARTPRPVLQLSLLARPGFLPAGLAVMFANFVMYTVFLAVPVFLTQLSGWGARDVGLLLAGMSILMAVTGPIGGTLSDRVGRRAPATFGSAVMIAGIAPLAFALAAWPWWALLLPLMVLGAGIGLSSAPVQTAAMQAAPVDLAGQAAGLFSTMRYAGSITGSAAMAAVLGDVAGVTSFHALFAILIGAALFATTAAGRLPGRVSDGQRALDVT